MMADDVGSLHSTVMRARRFLWDDQNDITHLAHRGPTEEGRGRVNIQRVATLRSSSSNSSLVSGPGQGSHVVDVMRTSQHTAKDVPFVLQIGRQS
jgi:hypothetical protein